MKFGAFALGAAFGVTLTLASTLFAGLARDVPRPSIFAQLPSKTIEVEPEVDRLTKITFPPGTREERLIADLSEMGFTLRLGKDGLTATYSAGGFICTESFYVTWHTSQDRTISSTTGGYLPSCL